MADNLENLKKKLWRQADAYVFPSGIENIPLYPHSIGKSLEAVMKITETDKERIRESAEFVICLRKPTGGGNTEWSTVEEWAEAVARHMFQRPRFNAVKWRHWMTTMFDVLDSDHDGYINKQELYMFYLSTNRKADKEFLARAFASIDTAGTGRISRQQYSDAYTNYMVDPDIPWDQLPLY